MADPLAIIGVIGVAGQLTKALAGLGLDWKDAPSDVRDFILELQTLKSTLSESNTNIILNPDFTSAFEGRHSAVLSHLGNDAPSTDARLLVDACHVELKRLLVDLEKRSRGHRAGWERVKGAFLAGRTREAVGKLQRQCQMLNSLVAIDSAALGAAVLNEVREGRREQMDQKAAAHRDAVLEWLTPNDYAAQQSDHLGRRRSGTGQWLIDSKEYSTWRDADGGILFCPGIPGAGKTIITSIVIEDLTRTADQTTCVAYAYCDFRQQAEQTAQNLLSSLLRQLARGQTSLPDSVDALHRKHSKFRTRPSMAELHTTLTSVASLYSRASIVIDALDESPFNERDAFLEAVSDLHRDSQVSLFATARPEVLSHFSEHFVGYGSKEIRAADGDILNYVNGRLATVRRPRLSKFPDLQDAIRQKIVESAEGMFLLSVLQLNHLLSKATAGDIEDELIRLPRGLSGLDVLYGQAMQRISNQNAGRAELAIKVLSWIVHAKRPLSAVELQHAVAIRPGDRILNDKHLTEIEDLVLDCAGLVTVNDERNVVRLVHFTTQDYFERTRATWFPDAEAQIVETCIAYLSFDVFGTNSARIQHDDDDIYGEHDYYEENECHCEYGYHGVDGYQAFPFYTYATENWGHHARESDANPVQPVIHYLEDLTRVRAALAWLTRGGRAFSLFAILPRSRLVPLTGLHLVAYFDVARYVPFLVKRSRNPDPLDDWGQTPLSWAARKGYLSTAEALVFHGAKLDHEDYEEDTPLMLAAARGHEGVIELLLRYGADINYRNRWGQSPLSRAARDGQGSTAALLMDHGADTHHRDNNGMTPLALAAESGHAAVVQMFLDVDTLDVDVSCKHGRTPLWYSTGARGMTFSVLLARGADPRHSDVDGWSPLHRATFWRNTKVVEILVGDSRVDVNSRDKSGKTPLHTAVENSVYSVVKLLLACDGVDPNVEDNDGDTALLSSARLLCKSPERDGNGSIAGILAANDKIDVNRQDSAGHTALAFAAWAGDDRLVSLLLAHGADPGVANSSGKTALELAARNEHREVVRLLLRHGGEDPGRFDWLLWDRDSGALWADHVLRFLGLGALISPLLRRSQSMEVLDIYPANEGLPEPLLSKEFY